MAMDKATDDRFTAYLLNAVRRALVEIKYNAGDFRGMINADGGYRAAVTLLTAKNPSEGFSKLWEKGRLDLSLEALVLDKEWSPYFSADLLEIARTRLLKVGYKLSPELHGVSPSVPRSASETLLPGEVYARSSLSFTVLLNSHDARIRLSAARALKQASDDGACQAKAGGGDGPGDVPLHRPQPRAGGSLWVGQAL